jgi:O-6-methylguanine DNA methyltransferase
MPLCHTQLIESPLGPLFAVFDQEGRLTRLDFLGQKTLDDANRALRRAGLEPSASPAAGAQVEEQLGAYFAGRRRVFQLALEPSGSEFQLAAWRALVDIPFGQTRSYAEQAHAIGRADAVRAVGRANGANPIAIIIPCHRVIGRDGSLTGYAGGLSIKRALLEHEGALAPAQQMALF